MGFSVASGEVNCHLRLIAIANLVSWRSYFKSVCVCVWGGGGGGLTSDNKWGKGGKGG